MTANCLIADDEPLAAQLLQKYVLELGSLKLAGTCSNAMEVTSFLHQNKVDLLFLDIQMPRITGIELLKVLKNPPAVIITTAHREYALEGYDFDIVDYLLKPITFERFMAAVEKFYRRKKYIPQSHSSVNQASPDKFIHIKSGTKIHQLNEEVIVYIESLKDHIKVHFNDGEKILIKYKIGQLELELSSNFIRVHKSYLVNKNKIKVFTATQIEVGSICVPIGNSYKAMVEDYLRK